MNDLDKLIEGQKKELIFDFANILSDGSMTDFLATAMREAYKQGVADALDKAQEALPVNYRIKVILDSIRKELS